MPTLISNTNLLLLFSTMKLASERRKKQEEIESKKDSQPTKVTGVLPSSEEKPATYRRGVGKYIPSTATSPSQAQRY